MNENYVRASARLSRSESDPTSSSTGEGETDVNRLHLRVVVMGLAVAAAGMVAMFAVLLDDVVRSRGLVTADLSTVVALAGVRGSTSVTVMRTISAVGSPAAMCVLAAAVCGGLAWRRGITEPLVLGLTGVGGVAVLETAAKYMVERSRPPLGLHAVAADGYSFPSGHASFSAVALPLCCALVARWVLLGRWSRVVLWLCTLALVAGVGFSRVFLGAHYPTDVLGGWCLAGAWDVVVLLAAVLVPVRRSRAVVSAPRHAVRR